MSTTYTHIKGEIVVSAQLHCKPGQGNEVAAWIERLKEDAAVNEPGTIEYSFARDSPDGDVFAVWERFADVDAMKAHATARLMQEFIRCDLLAKPPSHTFYCGRISGENA
ncbi:hypothetical protein PUNSTDRAFT_136268 [Punctularia strigosozonata HHB-11173 SS5]|uniref:uncharacterized protein n=1 Tax=Punctularia strigosozonata (strain HHB-11173) TaxID=741275 RepID=UPI0004416B53|nr:uncharacterized protein PUNSTDRAFT_136268 [Punctularia strigosozonata HHB-11173 SS5]EIN06404.1 hypothetical protein PUNSTDRAFT_136268 [Punctularia strigosozonata HHB-11173 SS5]